MLQLIYDFFKYYGHWPCLLFALGYLIYGQAFAKNEENGKKDKKKEEDKEDTYLPYTQRPSYETDFFTPESAQYPDSDNRKIIIAADATPERAGGLIYLPRDKVVYYYTVDWRPLFDFSGHDSDKFEMTNSLVALESFRTVSGDCRNRYDKLVLKVDNTFCTGKSYKKNAGCRKLFEEITQRLQQQPFFGEWAYTPSKDDVYIRIADRLSRAKETQALELIKRLGFAVVGIKCSDKFCSYTLNYVKNTIMRLGNSSNLNLGLLDFLNHRPQSVLYKFTGECIHEPEPDDRKILIAVNSTPEHAGGMMYIPEYKKVHYYSVNWSNVFDFSGLSDYKFKMINSLLALEFFETFLNLNRFRYSQLVLKVDSAFFVKDFHKNKGAYRELFADINQKLHQFPFFGKWRYTPKHHDITMCIANMLSRGREDLASILIQRLGSDVQGIKYSNNVCNVALYKVKTTIQELISSSHRNRELIGLLDETFLLSESCKRFSM